MGEIKKSTMSVWTRHNMFDPAVIHKSTTTSRKDKVRLLFRRNHYSCDVSEDGSAITRYKIMDGVIFVMNVNYTPPKGKK